MGVLGLVAENVAYDEVAFVLDAWSKSYRDSPWAGTITNDKYQEVQRGTINALVARGASILVAVPEDPDMPRRAVGFVCLEAPGLLHYLYVKRAYRGKGIARGLCEAAETALGHPLQRLTHRTRASERLLAGGLRWDPVPARLKELRGT